MKFDLQQGMEVLAATPRVVRALLQNVSEMWVRSNYGPDTFSPFDVVGHLIHGEKTDWMPRIRIILEHGPERAFDPFDRYAMREANLHKSIAELLAEFERMRNANLDALRSLRLTPEQLALRGSHPALGLVTLENLLATWAVHDLNHIAQIAKAMSFQYADAVGPWRQYLSILRPSQS